jgi:hypothetical protein
MPDSMANRTSYRVLRIRFVKLNSVPREVTTDTKDTKVPALEVRGGLRHNVSAKYLQLPESALKFKRQPKRPRPTTRRLAKPAVGR